MENSNWWAKKNGAKIISLTKVVSNPLSQLADISIKTIAENENFRLTAISSTITQLTVIDAIFILLNKRNYNKNLLLSRKNTEIVKILKVKKWEREIKYFPFSFYISNY